jgi:hypothetical protein
MFDDVLEEVSSCKDCLSHEAFMTRVNNLYVDLEVQNAETERRVREEGLVVTMEEYEVYYDGLSWD